MKTTETRKYVKGYELVLNRIYQMRGWVDKTWQDSEGNTLYHIQADDSYDGARGTVLSTEYGPVTEMEREEGWWKNPIRNDLNHKRYFSDRGFKPGDKVKHFKGNIYTIIAIGLDCETLEDKVVYGDESGKVWVRNYEDFDSRVPSGRDSDMEYRFEKIE